MANLDSLHAAALTPTGRGAVATIHVSGALQRMDEYFRAVNSSSAASQKINQICYGHWGDDPVEDVVFIRLTEQSAELHCHGGSAAVSRILGDIKRLEGVVVPWQSLAEHASTIELECEAALLKATTLKTSKLLLRQCQLFPMAFKQLDQLNDAERALRIDALLTWSNFGLHLTQPWQVVLCGRPNVGKSSLINALVGYHRSVVFDQPGTTRDVVSEQTALNGWPVEFSDTAGIRETTGDIESQGIQRARARLQKADLQVIVIDATLGITESDQELINEFPQGLVVMNKCDLATVEALNIDAFVSAYTGDGIASLLQTIVSRLIPEQPTEGVAYPVTQQHVQLLTELRSRN